MIEKKILEKRINIRDPEYIYSPDPTSICMKILTRYFVGKCFNSCKILKINKILQPLEDIEMSTIRRDGIANVNVLFEADILIYNKGEIIPNCKIIEKTRKDIRCSNNHARIFIKIKKGMETFLTRAKIGDTIPVIGYKSIYKVNKSSITVYAKPLIPLFSVYDNVVGLSIYPKLILFKIGNFKFNAKDLEHMEYLFNLKHNVENKLKELTSKNKGGKVNENKLKMFKKLLYPFKLNKSSSKTKKDFQKLPNSAFNSKTHPKINKILKESKLINLNNMTDLKSIEKLESGFIFKPPEIPKEESSFYYLSDGPKEINLEILKEIDENKEQNKSKIIKDDLFQVLKRYIKEQIVYLDNLYELCNVYEKFGDAEKVKYVWDYYNELKIR